MDTLILLIIVVAAALLSQVLVSKGVINSLPARKFLHIIAISTSAFSVYIADYTLLLWVVLVAVPILFLLVIFGIFNSKDQHRNSWGIFYYALVFLIFLWLFPHQPAFIFFPLIILALADGFAALTGYYFGRHWYNFGHESKSIEGSVVFFLFTLFCLQILPLLLPFAERPFASVYSVIIVSVFLTLVEAISIKGRDNLWIPIGVLYWFLIDTNFIGLSEFLLFSALGIIMYFIYKIKWLSSSGALAAALLGWTLLISTEKVWIIPTVVFLVLGTLISKLPKKEIRSKENGRNANQVFSNGGFYVIFLGLYFISNQMLFLIGGLASLTAAMSDTGSSEIGSRYGTGTFNITNGKKVAAGLSGGISLVGTLAGFIFAAIFAFIPFIISGRFDTKIYLILCGVAIFGNLFDSIFGALFQVKYRENPNMPWVDYDTGSISQEMRGYTYITNDVVNLVTTVLAAVSGTTFYIFL